MNSGSAGAPILVVEDDSNAAGTFQLLLEQSGYCVEIVTDVAEGIMRLQAEPTPSLILLDYILGRNTAEDFHRLQAHCPAPIASIPVVIYSGIYDVRSIAHRLHAADHFAKPIDPAHVLKIIQKLCPQ